MDTTNKIIQLSVSTLKYTNIIDIEGDAISFEHLTNSIETDGVKEAIFVDKHHNIISGNRRVLISNDLQLEFIPAIILDEDITPFEIEKFKIDFLLTNRNVSHLDIIQIYYYQNSIFEKYEEPYTEYMSKLLECTQRSIQIKVRAGKMYSELSSEVKKIFQTLDSTKKVPFKTFKVMSTLEEIDLTDFVKEVLEVENIQHKHLVSITSKYEQRSNEKRLNKDINEDSQKSKESKEITLSEILKKVEPINELKSSGDSANNITATVVDFKKVLNYEIEKYFNLDIDTTLENEVKVIQSKFYINFTEEIELISSLLLEEAA